MLFRSSIADLEDALSEQQGAERDEELETLRAQIKEQSVKLKEFNVRLVHVGSRFWS